MTDFLILILLLSALAIGFFWGRRGAAARLKRDQIAPVWDRAYFKGLNLLLNEQPDAAIDAFIEALEVNSDTLETHLALGNLLRRQGEVDRAIRIHQNLLARPGLSINQQHQAQFELARDYIKAGVFDRSEKLLRELIETSPEIRDVCLEYLIEIYREEQEWEKAIKSVEHLAGRRFSKVAAKWRNCQAHFCCELAEAALQLDDKLNARRYLKSALAYDKNSVRASLALGNIEFQQGNDKEAIRALKKIATQDPDFIGESIELLSQCFERLQDEMGFERHLKQLLELHPTNSVILALTQRIQKTQGDIAAAEFIGNQLKVRPSLRGVNRLLDFYVDNSKERAKGNLELLKDLIDQLLAAKPSYRCVQCGFTGNHLHWLCPSCKSWSTVRAIKGVEGE